MFGFLANPAFWAAIAALLAAIGIELPGGLAEHVTALVAAICGIVGILQTLWAAGHRVKYIKPDTNS